MTLPGIGGTVGGVGANPTLSQAITSLGLTTNLKLCLDAGDVASVASSSQTKWLDVSGGGYDFFRGSTASSQSSDPTFHGAPGGQGANEYYSFDGGDYFTYDTTVETWMSALHKDNAIGAFAVWHRPPSALSAPVLLSTFDGTNAGITMQVTDTSMLVEVRNASASVAFSGTTSTFTASWPDWTFSAFSMSEAANTCFLQKNATQVSKTCTFSSPATTSSVPMTLGALASATSLLGSSSRMAQVAIWQGTLVSQAQMLALYQATRGRFGV